VSWWIRETKVPKKKKGAAGGGVGARGHQGAIEKTQFRKEATKLSESLSNKGGGGGVRELVQSFQYRLKKHL